MYCDFKKEYRMGECRLVEEREELCAVINPFRTGERTALPSQCLLYHGPQLVNAVLSVMN